MVHLQCGIATPDTTNHGDHDHIVMQQPYDPHFHDDDHGYNMSRNNSADFFNFAVQAGEIPLDGHSAVSNNDAHGDAIIRNSSTDSLKDDLKIHK